MSLINYLYIALIIFGLFCMGKWTKGPMSLKSLFAFAIASILWPGFLVAAVLIAGYQDDE